MTPERVEELMAECHRRMLGEDAEAISGPAYDLSIKITTARYNVGPCEGFANKYAWLIELHRVQSQLIEEVLREKDDEIERLREALKPFAEYANRFPGQPDSAPIYYLPIYGGSGEWATIGDCRKAKEVLDGKQR